MRRHRLMLWPRQYIQCCNRGRVFGQSWGHWKAVSSCVSSSSTQRQRTMSSGGEVGTSNSPPGSRPPQLIAVCQLTCTADKQSNFQTSRALIERAKSDGAKMVFLPEACDYIAESKKQSMEMAESLQGETITQFQKLAQNLDLWLSIGGFHQAGHQENSTRLYNTHVVIDNQGAIQGTYSKTHLFDLDIPGKLRLCESDYTIPGETIQPPVATPIGQVGMGICYDLRFPEMSVILARLGAEILTYPSAFTVPTGQAHWEVLLRNRAIENQCYVVAAAQTGRHNDKRSSYGHSMVIDPWGKVIAECQEEVGICTAQIDLEYLRQVRSQMPVSLHRRTDIYGQLGSDCRGSEAIDSQLEYQFGQHQIGSSQVFLRTALSYAFVNIKPVVLGHVLVASLRACPRLGDLSAAETSDLFNTVQKVAKVIQKHFGGTSLTVAVQDGPDAGQTVEHVHIHVMPRKPGDFPQNDDIYAELQKHDADLEGDRKRGALRSVEEMNTEARQLRSYF